MTGRVSARRSRLAGVLAQMKERLGPRRLAAVLRRVVVLKPRAAAPSGQERLALARSLIARGLLGEAAREITGILNGGPVDPPTPLVGAVQAVLVRLGWAVRSKTAPGEVRLAVTRAGDCRDLFELGLEARGGGACGAARSITPVIRLRLRPRGGARGMRAPERAGLEELSSALGLLLESLWGQAGEKRALAQAEAHEGQEGLDLLLRTTFACNMRCPFCFVPLTGRGAESAEIERELDALAGRAGPRGELTISGGEPTVDPRLPRIIEAARRRGFRRFVLQTNGVLLARPGLLERLVRLGVRTYLVSFHSHRAALYDKITGSRRQHLRAVAGLTKLIGANGCYVTVNVVVNARNYRDLPGLMGFLGRLSAGAPRERRPGVYFSMINEAGHEKAPSWAVSLERVAPHLRRAVERCRHEGLRVERFGGESSFPVCLLRDPGPYAAHRDFPQDRVRYAEEFSGEAGAVGRAKRPACRRCPYDPRCLGVPAQYARMFGLGALRVPEAARLPRRSVAVQPPSYETNALPVGEGVGTSPPQGGRSFRWGDDIPLGPERLRRGHA